MSTLIIYFSKYGQTEKISNRIAERLQEAGDTVKVADSNHVLAIESPDAFDRVILGSPLYVGRHAKQVAAFIERYRSVLSQKRTAFFSVSASAAGNEQQRGDAIRCMDEFLSECDFEPNLKTIFAGAIPYREYNWFIRMVMKLITGRAGGDTDTSKNYEYTNWIRVDEFADSMMSEVRSHAADSVACTQT